MFRKQSIFSLFFLPAIIIAGFLLSCSPRMAGTGKIGVVVTILPQADFVRAVGGDRVRVSVLVPPGANPHSYEPKPSQIADFSRAKIYAKVGSGVEFELAWMDKLLGVNKGIEVIDCSKGVSLLDSSGEYHDADGHGELKDPHIWMSPPNAVKMVQNIYEGLIRVDPENRGYYESNRDAYINRLTILDKDIRDRLSGVSNRRFIAYHSAFEYFAREYGLTTLTVEVDGKEPAAAGVTRLIKEAKDYNIRVIFTSAEFNPQSAKVIAGALEGRVVMVDTLPANYIDSMYIFLDELIKSWEQA